MAGYLAEVVVVGWTLSAWRLEAAATGSQVRLRGLPLPVAYRGTAVLRPYLSRRATGAQPAKSILMRY